MPLVLLIFHKAFMGPGRKCYYYSGEERRTGKLKAKSWKPCKMMPTDYTGPQNSAYLPRTRKCARAQRSPARRHAPLVQQGGEKCEKTQGPEAQWLHTGTVPNSKEFVFFYL